MQESSDTVNTSFLTALAMKILVFAFDLWPFMWISLAIRLIKDDVPYYFAYQFYYKLLQCPRPAKAELFGINW